jgi:hypothetical protein
LRQLGKQWFVRLAGRGIERVLGLGERSDEQQRVFDRLEQRDIERGILGWAGCGGPA